MSKTIPTGIARELTPAQAEPWLRAFADTAVERDVITVCPYCGEEYHGRLGCCGEANTHGIRVYADTGDAVEECQ